MLLQTKPNLRTMNTKDTKVYNILWADDEIATLLAQEQTRRWFLTKHIHVLDKDITTSEKLKIALDRYKDMVDAVIIDANFCRDDNEKLTSSTFSGLIHAATLVEMYNLKREIPFYLYTTRKDELQTICCNRELDYFVSSNRIFAKNEIEDLTQMIINDVNHIQSTISWVNCRYGSLLNEIREIDETAAEHLHDFLMLEARDIDFNKQVDMFNHLRKMMEAVQTQCHHKNIIPKEATGLNAFVYFWGDYGFIHKVQGQPNTVYKPKDDYMPKFLQQSLFSMVNLLQDGSHKSAKLPLHLTKYIEKHNRPFVFRFALHYVLEFLMWYKELLSKLETEPKYQTPLYYSEVQHRNHYQR